jgi:protein-S-isoprenylcysteine O-methyltransferase Ste14
MQHEVTQTRLPILMRIPPPLLFVATFLAGVALQRVLPHDVSSPRAIEVSYVVGCGLLAAGIGLALSCVALFLLSRTTLVPFGTASKLVTRGPYQFTRNPMYVSLVLAYAGAAGVLAMPWPLLLLPLPVIGLNSTVIPFEENRLRTEFGAEFENYCGHVRRWL